MTRTRSMYLAIFWLCACAGANPKPDGIVDADAEAAGPTEDAAAVSPGNESLEADSGSSDAQTSTPSATDCDPRKILCKRAAPICPEGEVPSVSDSCYGPCVKLETCPCDKAADCPDPDHGTCHMFAKHCGPYV